MFEKYVHEALKVWKTKCVTMGFHLKDKTIYTYQFADDKLVLAQEINDVEYITRKLIETNREWKLTNSTSYGTQRFNTTLTSAL